VISTVGLFTFISFCESRATYRVAGLHAYDRQYSLTVLRTLPLSERNKRHITRKGLGSVPTKGLVGNRVRKGTQHTYILVRLLSMCILVICDQAPSSNLDMPFFYLILSDMLPMMTFLYWICLDLLQGISNPGKALGYFLSWVCLDRTQTLYSHGSCWDDDQQQVIHCSNRQNESLPNLSGAKDLEIVFTPSIERIDALHSTILTHLPYERIFSRCHDLKRFAESSSLIRRRPQPSSIARSPFSRRL